MPPPATPSVPRPAPGRRPRRLLPIGLAAFSLLTAATAVAVLSDGPARPPASSADPPNPGAAVGGSLAPEPARPVTATEGQTDLPADLTWASVAGVALPVSATEGPRRSGAIAGGFAHTPAGSVLAAAHIVIRTTPQVGSDVFGPTIRDQVVGPDADAMAQRVGDAYDDLRIHYQVAPGEPAGTLYARLRGFRIEQYTGDDVYLRLVTEGPTAGGGTGLVSSLLQLRWEVDDWALVAPPGGDFAAVMAPAGGLENYVQFPTEVR